MVAQGPEPVQVREIVAQGPEPVQVKEMVAQGPEPVQVKEINNNGPPQGSLLFLLFLHGFIHIHRYR